MKNSFATLEEKIYELENEESELTSSDSEDSAGYYHFQFHKNVMEPQRGFQILQTERNNRDQTAGVGVVLQQLPEKRINKVLLDNKHADYINFNLIKVILLNSQSTMGLICNEYMVERIYKLKKKMRLHSNGGKIIIDQKSVVAGYIKDMWFDKTTITNIFAPQEPDTEIQSNL